MSQPVETIKSQSDRVRIEVHYDQDPMNPRKEFDNISTMLCAHGRYNLGDEELSTDCSGWEGALHLYFYQNNTKCSQWVDAQLQEQYENEYNAYLDTLGPEDEDQWYDSRWWEDHGVEEGEPHHLIAQWIENNVAVSSLYLYDHGGVSMSTGPFSCSWDSGKVGFAFIEKEKALAELTCDKINWQEAAQRSIDIEVETYSDYLEGQVYGVIAYLDDKHFESCWGFYGYDHEKSGLMYYAKDFEKCALAEIERQTQTQLKEKAEAEYWAYRDVVTV